VPLPYYMMTGSNTQPLALRTIDPSRLLPFGTWCFTFRNYQVGGRQSTRTKYSVFDEAIAIVRNRPLHTGAVISSYYRESRAPLP
jgi:hypothetical protein